MSTLRFVSHSYETFITIGLPNKSSTIEVLARSALNAVFCLKIYVFSTGADAEI